MITKPKQLVAGVAATATAAAMLTGLAPGTAPVAHAASSGSVRVVRTLVKDQNVPWGLARLPGGGVLYTTRDNHVVKWLNPKNGSHRNLGRITAARSDPADSGEGGLLGIAVDPHFTSNHLLYVYYSTASDNRVARVKLYSKGRPYHRLGTPQVILKGIPHSTHHNGGQLSFGPGGRLFVTTGDAENTSLPQNKRSLGGKILRITTSGKPAPGDPINGSPVWTWGHRNVQGLVWDPSHRLWASEFGDRTADELNLIQKGHDYGWPATQGRTSDKAYTSPVAQWATEVDSPSGIAYTKGTIWMAALKGERLWRVPISGSHAAGRPKAYLIGKYGRLRSLLWIGKGRLLVTTSNTDGRGAPTASDDRILELSVR